ncbi:Retrovirus-related Pol polyprotein from transposon opus [Araneus ventricosus]|uniref:Retrovirus-related Pol polyprotein from transposon opus n=1 Tax=Araneus ventricosus TaxID=182803 RepID=A0A4Y2BEM3_ARAVE|nr:Retrovirus-related Pol polyprotein from transposon opus [Araneus ventricosus]
MELNGKTMFYKFNFVKAYNQILVNPADIGKTAVTTPVGLFEFNKIFFGPRNYGQTFHPFMDEVLRGLNCYVYLDGILVASKDFLTHMQDLRHVFQRLDQYSIVLNVQKCVFGQSEMPFLGVLVRKEYISPLPEKVKSVTEFPLPNTVYELRRYFSMIKFYHRFLPRVAYIQTPLYNLVKSKKERDKTPINWTQDTLDACKTRSL